jgi:cAMP phosphodiesterase
MKEMGALNELCGDGTLKELPIVITHIKPNGNNEEKIKKELSEMNALGLKLIFPQQAKVLEF